MSTSPSNNRARRALQAGTIALAVGAGYATHSLRVDAQGGGGTTVPPTQKAPVVQTPATRDAATTQNAFSEVAESVEPAVVTIETIGPRVRSTTPNGGGGIPGLPFGGGGGGEQGGGAGPNGDFQQFFKDFQRNFGFNQQSYNPNSIEGQVLRDRAEVKWREIQSSRRSGGLGSGMIYSSNGLILTNAHVVRGADTVTVTLSDGRKFENAKVLGRDERTDIAVVKVEATGLPTVKLGDSTGVRTGDWAIAVGNPFGLDHTLTVGVISAKGREINLASNGDSRTDYLQTDASINPGNSGGPLLDIYGRVIGVNNAIYSESGGNQGIGFAIPVDTARFVAEQIAKNGRVRRGYLGVKIAPVDSADAVAFGLAEGTKGVLIASVEDPKAPGAIAGLLAGDVVTKFDGKAVTKPSELQGMVGNSPVGSTITLTVLRGERTIDLKAILKELPEGPAAPATPDKPGNDGAAGPTNGTALSIPGLKVRNLSPAVAKALGIEITTGVVVTSVDADSPADDAGLQRGDVIEQVGQTKVSTLTELQGQVNTILGRQKGVRKQVALYVNRGGTRNFVTITIGGN